MKQKSRELYTELSPDLDAKSCLNWDKIDRIIRRATRNFNPATPEKEEKMRAFKISGIKTLDYLGKGSELCLVKDNDGTYYVYDPKYFVFSQTGKITWWQKLKWRILYRGRVGKVEFFDFKKEANCETK